MQTPGASTQQCMMTQRPMPCWPASAPAAGGGPTTRAQGHCRCTMTGREGECTMRYVHVHTNHYNSQKVE